MSMDLSPNIDTNLSRTETVSNPPSVVSVPRYRISCQTPPRMGSITNSLSPITPSDIPGILQREHDHAMTLLSSSRFLTSLFVSYANQAAAFESSSATPSPESAEWKALQDTIAALQEEIKKLKSDTEASLEAFRSQVSSLKEVNTSQENDIKSLREELIETKEKYDRPTVDSDTEMIALRNLVSDLEVCFYSCLITNRT